MGIDDKVEHKGEEVKGHVKQAVGDATDNPRLQAEGERDEKTGKLKQAGDHVADAARRAADAIKD